MTDKDIQKLLQRMGTLIELASAKTTFADESKSDFDIYNHRDPDGKYNVPKVPMVKYLTRFHNVISIQYDDDKELSIKVLILAMTFIDQFMQRNPEFKLTDLNCHQLVCVAALEANKVLMDISLANNFFARLGGVNLELINRLEIDFFAKMRFNFKIDPLKFSYKAKSLGLPEKQVAEMLAFDANYMSAKNTMDISPRKILLTTPNSTPSNPTPSNSTTPNRDYKTPQNKIIGWMSNLCPKFSYKNSKTTDSQSQSSRSTSSSGSTKYSISTKVSPKCYNS